MALKTETYLVCDSCGVALRQPKDGVCIHGAIAEIGPVGTRKVLVSLTGDEETVFCWKCLVKKLCMPEPQAHVEYVYEKKPEYRDTYMEPYKEPGHGPTGPLLPPDLGHAEGPTGPLPPPDLEHVVRVVRKMCVR